MKNHEYKITCEYLRDAEGNTPLEASRTFTIGLHENVFQIMDKMNAKERVPAEDVAPFALGLKLLGEVLRRNKDSELCASLHPHFVEIMKTLKKS